MALIGDPTANLTFRSTTYREADGSPSGVYSVDRGQVTRTYYVDWAARNTAALDFAGTATVVRIGRYGYVSRTLPHSFAPMPHLRCTNILAVKPIGIRGADGLAADGTAVTKYEMAELTCQYTFPTYKFLTDAQVRNETPVAPDNITPNPWFGQPDEAHALATGIANSRYITRTLKYSTRELVTNRGLLKTNDGGTVKPILEGIPLRETTGEVSYTWHNVPEDAVPQRAMIAGGSSVNLATFDGWTAGTLLAHNMPELMPRPNIIDGKTYYDLTYRFSLLMLYDKSTDPATVRGHNWIRRLTGTGVNAKFKPFLVTTSGAASASEFVADAERLMFPPYDFEYFFRPDNLP